MCNCDECGESGVMCVLCHLDGLVEASKDVRERAEHYQELESKVLSLSAEVASLRETLRLEREAGVRREEEIRTAESKSDLRNTLQLTELLHKSNEACAAWERKYREASEELEQYRAAPLVCQVSSGWWNNG